MRIGVIGLGYVGAVTAACLARDGHDVIGIDVDPTKLALLERGQPPIIEEGLEGVTAQAAQSGRLALSHAVDGRVAECDLIFVCVGTPSAANGNQNLAAVERVAEELGSALRQSAHYATVVLRSTVPPGTTQSVLQPLLERASGKQCDVGFGLCFQPEFLREGSSIRDFYQPPFTIVGAETARPIAKVRELFGRWPGEFVVTTTRVAEMVKLASNAFHALKVSFANEIGRLARSLDVDARGVMELVCKDTSLNISPAYLRPGFAYGGSCLPKDLRALLHLAKRNDVDVPLLQGVVASNLIHIEHAATLIKAGAGRKVGLIGLSFKPGTDDLRESPLVALAEHLIGKGYELRIFDPAVSLARLTGANKRYIEQMIPHLAALLLESLDELCLKSDVVVIGQKHSLLERALARRSTPVRIVDLVGGNSADGRNEYTGICW